MNKLLKHFTVTENIKLKQRRSSKKRGKCEEKENVRGVDESPILKRCQPAGELELFSHVLDKIYGMNCTPKSAGPCC